MDGFDKEVLSRVPLAEAVLLVFRYVCEAEMLDQIFDEHRGRSYERELAFSLLVALVLESLITHKGSAKKCFGEAHANGDLTVSDVAAYQKLRNIPLRVSQKLLSEGTNRLHDLFPAAVSSPLSESLHTFEAFAIDGKKLKRLSKRLKVARGKSGKLLGGKTLVARDLHRGISVAMQAHEDGEVNDGPLVPGLLGQLEELYPDSQCLIMMDSQFCDLTTTRRILELGWHFVARYHPKTQFCVDDTVEQRNGIDSEGRDYVEEIGFLGSPRNKNRIKVRRITVSRSGQEPLIVVTSLLDMDTYSAVDILLAYKDRWHIETMFQHVTSVFGLQHLIGSTAKGSVFQASLCLLLYNIIRVVMLYLADQHDREVEELSTKNLFDSFQDELAAIHVMIPPKRIASLLPAAPTAKDVRSRLRVLLKSTWKPRWLKAPKNKRRPPSELQPIYGGHTSIYRLQQAAQRDPPT